MPLFEYKPASRSISARPRRPTTTPDSPLINRVHHKYSAANRCVTRTLTVYEELLGSAKHSICASTYAFFDGHKAFEILARRMEAKPALRVTLLLNIQRKRGDTTASDQLVRRFADRFWKTDWPGSSRPGVFYDPRALELEGPAGVLHAKAVVADDEAVFITSANLTEAALDRNIELGVLIRDHAIALTIAGYFRSLVDRSLLEPLPLA